MAAREFRTPARVSQRNVKAVAGAAIAQTQHAQDVLQRGVIPALAAFQQVTDAHRADILGLEESRDDAERRLWRHRAELDDLRRDVDCVNNGLSAVDISHDARLVNLEAERRGFFALSFFGRLRWLLTGRVK